MERPTYIFATYAVQYLNFCIWLPSKHTLFYCKAVKVVWCVCGGGGGVVQTPKRDWTTRLSIKIYFNSPRNYKGWNKGGNWPNWSHQVHRQRAHCYIEIAVNYVNCEPSRNLDRGANLQPATIPQGTRRASSRSYKSSRRGFGERHTSCSRFPPQSTVS